MVYRCAAAVEIGGEKTGKWNDRDESHAASAHDALEETVYGVPPFASVPGRLAVKLSHQKPPVRNQDIGSSCQKKVPVAPEFHWRSDIESESQVIFMRFAKFRKEELFCKSKLFSTVPNPQQRQIG